MAVSMSQLGKASEAFARGDLSQSELKQVEQAFQSNQPMPFDLDARTSGGSSGGGSSGGSSSSSGGGSSGGGLVSHSGESSDSGGTSGGSTSSSGGGGSSGGQTTHTVTPDLDQSNDSMPDNVVDAEPSTDQPVVIESLSGSPGGSGDSSGSIIDDLGPGVIVAALALGYLAVRGS